MHVIRHALLDGDAANVDQTAAPFMLSACRVRFVPDQQVSFSHTPSGSNPRPRRQMALFLPIAGGWSCDVIKIASLGNLQPAARHQPETGCSILENLSPILALLQTLHRGT